VQTLPKDLLRNARNLRRRMTDAEMLLWAFLRARRLGGFKFRRQKIVGRAVLDFYCAEQKLAVELDGGGHTDSAQIAHDKQRTCQLNQQGIRVLRFWNNEVLMETELVLEAIWRALHDADHPLPVPLPPAGEGTYRQGGREIRTGEKRPSRMEETTDDANPRR